MIWDGDGFFFRYTALHTGTTVIASGPMPFIAKSGIRAGLAKGVLQGLLIVIIFTASAIIIACGLILSHLLSRQILQPLETLRQAAAEIEISTIPCRPHSAMNWAGPALLLTTCAAS